MSAPVSIQFREPDPTVLAGHAGRIAVFASTEGGLDPLARKLDRLMKGALTRASASAAFAKLKVGEYLDLAYPAGLGAETVRLVSLPRKPKSDEARRAGAAIGRLLGEEGVLVLCGTPAAAADISYGLALRAYDFAIYLSAEAKPKGDVVFHVATPAVVAAAAKPMAALAEAVFFTRDLTNEPANVLTTDDFAARLAAMQGLGLDVEILEEPELERLGMRALLGVGQGSESPSKVVVMQWKGGGDEAPFALVGKGVVFDTGGISIKPAGGMEDMTMDMGGAGVVAGVMRALALRQAKANVVGLVGLVENMPDGKAQRPGDIVKSMRGVTIEVINTDAEGRLVLADVLWYAQERFNPCAMINLATLTGAIIVALGHENAGVFSNNDALADAFLAAARAEGEGAWRMPMGEAYDKIIKSTFADIRNSAGREAGAVTAAQFLGRFVKPEVPWCHLDIAGVASLKTDSTFAPKGATGWGVRSLDRLIRDRFEQR